MRTYEKTMFNKGNTGKRNRFLVIGLVILLVALFFVAGFLIGWYTSTRQGASTSPASSADSFDYVRFIADNLDRDRIRAALKDYSSEPRLAGTAKDLELALQIERQWKDNGLDEVHLSTYDVLLNYPNSSLPNVIQLINTTSQEVLFESHKYEVPLRESENNSNLVPPFNSYSPAGNVTGKMVYVNYGSNDDFVRLSNLSISVNGCIAIVRYGNIYRGDKVKNAQKFGAIAVILYSDPSDYNLDENVNNTYPNSWWLPPSGIERGTVVDDGIGDTPLYPGTSYANRLSGSKLKQLLPKIPVQPIGYNDAEKLLRRLAGPKVPPGWQGTLPFDYHIGPNLTDDALAVRVTVNNYNDVRPVHNVIGYITGSEEPDRYVLMGNHHDTWTFGAMDPLSGTAAITELTRVFGLMLKAGYRPKRTIVFCSWDAEEYNLHGSTEWVEDHLKLLLQRAIAYLNLDYPALSNYTLAVGTSPLLQDVLYSAAKKIPSTVPTLWTNFYDQWLARPNVKNHSTALEPHIVYSLGSVSDMATFYQRAGVPSVDMWFTYDEGNSNAAGYPLYHTSYDTFFAYDNFVDPGFTATGVITQMLGVMACELAWSDILPMNVKRYSAAISNFYDSLAKQFEKRWREKAVNIDGFRSAVLNFTAATQIFQDSLDKNRDTIRKSPLAARRVNDQLIFLERAFLDSEGLPGRPAQKHVVFAPSLFDLYVDNSFPGIVDTMTEIDMGEDKWEQLKQQVYIATYIVQSAASTLQNVGL